MKSDIPEFNKNVVDDEPPPSINTEESTSSLISISLSFYTSLSYQYLFPSSSPVS